MSIATSSLKRKRGRSDPDSDSGNAPRVQPPCTDSVAPVPVPAPAASAFFLKAGGHDFTAIVTNCKTVQERARLLADATDTKASDWQEEELGDNPSLTSVCAAVSDCDGRVPVVFGVDESGYFAESCQIKDFVHEKAEWPTEPCEFSAEPSRTRTVAIGECILFVSVPEAATPGAEPVADEDVSKLIVADLALTVDDRVMTRCKEEELKYQLQTEMYSTDGVPPQFDSLRKTPGFIFAWDTRNDRFLTKEEFVADLITPDDAGDGVYEPADNDDSPLRLSQDEEDRD